MRHALLPVLFLAACGTTPGTSEPPAKAGGEAATAAAVAERTRIVYRQYPRAGRKGSPIFIVENEAGRSVVELRSKPLKPGRAPVAYVPDDVMRKLLAEFRRYGYFRHAQARPNNPIKLGGIAELTIIDENRRMLSIIPTKLNPNQQMARDYRRSFEAYRKCKASFLAVWNYFRPFGQVTTSEAKFGRN